MRKALFTASITVFTAMGVTSCNDCEICIKDSSPEIRLCQTDYGNNTEYGLAQDYYTALGYICK